MNTKPTNFDINRHVLGIVDDEKKIVTIVLTCELHRAEEMFMKVVRSIAASYKGYEIVAPLFSINDKLNFALYANPIWKETNDALLQKRVSFLRTLRELQNFIERAHSFKIQFFKFSVRNF